MKEACHLAVAAEMKNTKKRCVGSGRVTMTRHEEICNTLQIAIKMNYPRHIYDVVHSTHFDPGLIEIYICHQKNSVDQYHYRGTNVSF